MLIDKNILSATKKMHHKETTSWKITLHVNKSKTIFGALLFKFLWTHTPKKQWNSLLLKLQLSVFAVAEVCIKNLARSLAVTTCTRIFFKKVNKANQMHGAKKSSQVSVLGKSSSKTSNKNLRSKPLCNSCKEHYYVSFLNKWNSAAFLHKCKDCRHCRNNGLLLIKIKISIIINKASI